MKQLTKQYFLNRGFVEVKNNIFIVHQYKSFGVFEERLFVRLLNDNHTWLLGIMPVTEYNMFEEIDLIEFCNTAVLENFMDRLLIEFKLTHKN